VIPSYANPQDLNRYSYVNNNPLRYTDPTGHMHIQEEGEKKGCSNPRYCQGGKPKLPDKKKDDNNSGGRKPGDPLCKTAQCKKIEEWAGNAAYGLDQFSSYVSSGPTVKPRDSAASAS
jgi:hypothetical protein